MANIPAPIAGGAGDISAERLMTSESKGSIEEAMGSQSETPDLGRDDGSVDMLQTDAMSESMISLAPFKITEGGEQSIEDDVSSSSIESGSSSGSESDSDFAEASDAKSERPASAKRPARVRSAWAVPLRIRSVKPRALYSYELSHQFITFVYYLAPYVYEEPIKIIRVQLKTEGKKKTETKIHHPKTRTELRTLQNGRCSTQHFLISLHY